MVQNIPVRHHMSHEVIIVYAEVECCVIMTVCDDQVLINLARSSIEFQTLRRPLFMRQGSN